MLPNVAGLRNRFGFCGTRTRQGKKLKKGRMKSLEHFDGTSVDLFSEMKYKYLYIFVGKYW